MRLAIATAAITSMGLLMPLAAAAESHEGVVRQIRVDSDADAPLCVSMSPAVPGGAWACIYPNRKHYAEMRELLLRALEARHRCMLEWNYRDALTNRAQVSSVTCSASQ